MWEIPFLVVVIIRGALVLLVLFDALLANLKAGERGTAFEWSTAAVEGLIVAWAVWLLVARLTE